MDKHSTKIVAVTNRKGGVGKSTWSVHLAAGLANLGWRVGLVDTDSQGHAGKLLGMPEANGLYELLVNKAALADVVQRVPNARYVATATPPDMTLTGEFEALWLLPSSDKTYKIPYELQPHESFLFLERLTDFVADFDLDVVLIDTNPTLSMFDGAVYLATDGFIYVTEAEAMAFDGIQEAISQAQQFSATRTRYLGRDTRIIGIIPNKLRTNTFVHRQNANDLASTYGALVWEAVPLRTLWTEASNLGELIYTYAPASGEAAAAWSIVRKAAEVLRAWA